MKSTNFAQNFTYLDFPGLIKLKKKVILIGLVLFSILLFPLISYSIALEQIPNPRLNNSWVSDTANILSQQTITTINQRIDQLEAKNGTEMAVVTIPNTSSFATPKQFTTALFNHWKIGKQGQDNGVLFMISVGDRRVEIETGYGVEGILPDARVGRIIDSQIIPKFKQGNFDQGVLDGTIALVKALENESFLPIDNLNLPSPIAINTIFVALLGFITYKIYQNNKGQGKSSEKIIAKIGAGGLTGLSLINNFSIIAFVLIILYSLFAYKLYQKSKAESLTLIPISPTGYFRFSSTNDDSDKELHHYIYWASFWFSNAVFIIGANFFGYFQDDHILRAIPTIVFCSVFSLVLAWFISGGIKDFFDQNKAGRALHKFCCNICDQEMEMISEQKLKTLLTRPQEVAIEIGSTAFEGWRCANCFPNIKHDTIHIRAYTVKYGYQECIYCQELTKESTSKVITPATYQSSGTMLVTTTCKCCGDTEQHTQIIPKLEKSSSSSSSSSGGGSSSSGGGSFGGGSSGGGGAGGSW
jgi:uncharacterized protein